MNPMIFRCGRCNGSGCGVDIDRVYGDVTSTEREQIRHELPCQLCDGHGTVTINPDIPPADRMMALAILTGDHIAALQAADLVHETYGSEHTLSNVVERYVAEEREACAQVATDYAKIIREEGMSGWRAARTHAENIAHNIRTRQSKVSETP